MTINPILNTDSYKVSHYKMTPDGTKEIYSYGEARFGGAYDEILFFGLQYIVQEYLTGEFVTRGELEEARAILNPHFGSDEFLYLHAWEIIIDEYNGRLPLEIKAVPEGTILPEGNVLFTIKNTDERFYWLTNYVETLLMRVWYPTTVSTRSYTIVKNIEKYMEKSSDIPTLSKFMLHDFGSRGTSSFESSAIGGAAHIVNSLGTDTLAGIKLLKDYYDADINNTAFSVAATEHSVACSFGKNEVSYLKHQLKKFPTGILSIVADTENIELFVSEVVNSLECEIVKRYESAKNDPIPPKVVIRPDSPRHKEDTPEDQVLWIVNELSEIFGYNTNLKGYKVLHPSIGVIYGDSLTEEQIDKIYNLLVENGWSAENCVVGQGGGLLQKLERDTCRFAIKASSVTVGGKTMRICKSPLDHSKSSKRGYLKLIKLNGEYVTVNDEDERYHENEDILETVFKDGELIKRYSLDQVRENTENW